LCSIEKKAVIRYNIKDNKKFNTNTKAGFENASFFCNAVENEIY